MAGIIGAYPYLVCQKLTEKSWPMHMHTVFMKERAAYQWMELSVYVEKNIRDWGWERRCTMH